MFLMPKNHKKLKKRVNFHHNLSNNYVFKILTNFNDILVFGSREKYVEILGFVFLEMSNIYEVY